ncbi:MAG: glycosyltransferase [Bacillaceae bacterium]|nr:glycosyltransferase [Bacillaceae bacterium]
MKLKKILFFPLLDSLPSGHHQAANAISEYIRNRSNEIKCKKVDIMHCWNPAIEKFITGFYLRWIQHFPKSYAWVYRTLAYKLNKTRSYRHYELLFLKKMKQIIEQEEPDLIICTHAFPSYLVNKLKKRGVCSVPVINVYTDFFINDVWGRDAVDHHFVSDINMKSRLVLNDCIPEQNVLITGVPVHESFLSPSKSTKQKKELRIIFSGGSAGLGKIQELIEKERFEEKVHFYVLCGKNKKLYQTLSEFDCPNVHPIPYISSREKMNDLYNMADAILTKPGGVTVSEAIRKKLPTFIHSALPGQEEINLNHLRKQGLVFVIDDQKSITRQILDVMNSEPKMRNFYRVLRQFEDEQEFKDPDQIFQFINFLLKAGDIQQVTNDETREYIMTSSGGVSGG